MKEPVVELQTNTDFRRRTSAVLIVCSLHFLVRVLSDAIASERSAATHLIYKTKKKVEGKSKT